MPANRKNNRHSKKAGMAPGTLMHVGERKLETARITVFDYNENSFQEKQVNTIDECFAFKTTSTVSWINVDGLHDISIIEKAGKHFDVHSLVLEINDGATKTNSLYINGKPDASDNIGDMTTQLLLAHIHQQHKDKKASQHPGVLSVETRWLPWRLRPLSRL